MGDIDALDDRRRSLQLDRSALELIEEGGAAAEQDGDQINPDLVEQASDDEKLIADRNDPRGMTASNRRQNRRRR